MWCARASRMPVNEYVTVYLCAPLNIVMQVITDGWASRMHENKSICLMSPANSLVFFASFQQYISTNETCLTDSQYELLLTKHLSELCLSCLLL
jgi:hypothetical protein